MGKRLYLAGLSYLVMSQQLLAKEQPLKAAGSCKTRLINLAVDTDGCRREILQSLAHKSM